METLQTNIVRRQLDTMGRRYDAENDTIPGAPSVTWADNELAEMINHLLLAIEDLQDQIHNMQS